MAPHEPADSGLGSEIIQLIRDVLGSWPMVMRVVVLVSTVIANLVFLAGLVVTVIFYLKLDPQRWAAVAGLGAVALAAAKAVHLMRGRRAGAEASLPADGAPSVTDRAAGAEGEAGPASDGEGEGDEDVNK